MRYQFRDMDSLIAYLLVLNIDELTTHESYFFRHFTYIYHDMPHSGIILCYSLSYSAPFSIAFRIDDNGVGSRCDVANLMTALEELRRRARQAPSPTISTSEGPIEIDEDDYSSSEESGDYSSSTSTVDGAYHVDHVRIEETNSEGYVTERWIPRIERPSMRGGWRNRVDDYFERDTDDIVDAEVVEIEEVVNPEEIEVFIHPVLNSTEES